MNGTLSSLKAIVDHLNKSKISADTGKLFSSEPNKVI